MKKVISGNEAAAWAAARAKAEVICVYPITPQTTIIEEISTLAARGVFEPRILHVESEHSAMAGCIGGAITGARSFTATSSQGLALMHELLHWAAGARLPIVMVDVNRAMAPGWSIWTDQNDTLSQRDTGWMQYYCESNQEVFDTVLQAYRVAERVMLPAMVILDAFVLSHTSEAVQIEDGELVARYLPPYRPEVKLDPDKPCSFGALLRPNHYQAVRKKLQESMDDAIDVARRADEEWRALTGRGYGIVERYRCEDAETLFVASATVASTARVVIDECRAEGRKVGLVKMRLFRPFPYEEVRRALAPAKKVAIFDRNLSYGHHGIFAQEIKSALYSAGGPKIFCYAGGLGGKEIGPEAIREMIEETLSRPAPKEEWAWI